MSKIGILGSINTDFVFRTKELPKPSETITGEGFATNFGGKGANEAVALARLGAKVSLFGAVGDDIFSRENMKNLKSQKVDISSLKVCTDTTGGVAGITVGSGTNSIVVVSGANAQVDVAYLKSIESQLLECEYIGTQLETPFKTVEYLIKWAKKNKKKIIFNPSPIRPISQALLDACEYVIVNEIEIRQLPHYTTDVETLAHYKGKLILTRGKEGAYYYDITTNKVLNIPSLKVKVTDTTGAGDTFLASFIYGLSKKMSVGEALKFANTCAGLKCTKAGAQTGMPTLKEVQTYLSKAKH